MRAFLFALLAGTNRSHAEHLQIFDALTRRDGNLAQALMSAHLQGAESYWKGLLGRAAEAGVPVPGAKLADA